MRKISMILFVSVVMVLFLGVDTQAAAPLPSWSAGNSWQYSISIENKAATTSVFANGNVWFNVTGTTTKTVGGNTYNAFVLSVQGHGSASISGIPIAGVFYMSGTAWQTTDTYSVIEGNMSTVISMMNTVAMRKFQNANNTPPENMYNFPIDVGNTWWSNSSQQSTIVIWMATGGTSKVTSTKDVSDSYICKKEGTINVPAGSFDSYNVNMTQQSTSNATEYWYAPQVGYFTMRNDTMADNASSWTKTNMMLVAFTYTTPEFAITLLPIIGVLAIMVATVAYMVRIKKQRA